MANAFQTQILIDGPRNVVVKATAELDTSDLAATTLIDPAALLALPDGRLAKTLAIDQLYYSISDQLEVQLLWDATTPVVIMPLAGRGKFPATDFGAFQNNAGAGNTGKILVKTTGWTSGIQVFTVTLECFKQF